MKYRSFHSHNDKATTDKRRILAAVLAEVPFDGWTNAIYERALEQCGFASGEADLLFSNGLRDVIEFFGSEIDAAVAVRIKKERSFTKLRTHEKIAFAVRARLEYLTPYREAMRRLLIWYALPFHWTFAAKRLYRTVDLIWRAAGDASTDFNFYTKRGLLAGVLKATALYWLDDATPDCSASWEFLDRRIAEVLKIGQALGKLRMKNI